MKVLTIWRLLDGKPGHESQTLGLANAMVRLGKEQDVNVQVYDIPIRRSDFGPVAWLLRRCVIGKGLPAPDLIMAAGSATHWALLCVRRAYGGRAVVLMRPSLPLSWFDWVVAPQHDGVSGPNVISTLGALNPMQPGIKKLGSVLVLVGGPSKHFEFDVDQVLQTLKDLLTEYPHARITDSRRTPEVLSNALESQYSNDFFSWKVCSANWLYDELSKAEYAWVTMDSVSMIYEAITAGCQTGLISLPHTARSRLADGVQRLVSEHRVVVWPMKMQKNPILNQENEANRVSKILLQTINTKSNLTGSTISESRTHEKY